LSNEYHESSPPEKKQALPRSAKPAVMDVLNGLDGLLHPARDGRPDFEGFPEMHRGQKAGGQERIAGRFRAINLLVDVDPCREIRFRRGVKMDQRLKAGDATVAAECDVPDNDHDR
jgi:hypothetical protein